MALAKVGLSDSSPPIQSAAANLDTAQRIGSIRGYFVMLGRDRADMPVVLGSAVIERSGQVKFLAGIDKDGQLVIVFDGHIDLHDALAKLHDLRPTGGGFVVIDFEQKRLRLGASSLAFGRESDRNLTLCMLQRALPDYVCTV